MFKDGPNVGTKSADQKLMPGGTEASPTSLKHLKLFTHSCSYCLYSISKKYSNSIVRNGKCALKWEKENT